MKLLNTPIQRRSVIRLALPLVFASFAAIGCNSGSAQSDQVTSASPMSTTQTAHPVRSPLMMPAQMLQSKLGLSDAQVNQLTSIHEKYRQQMDAQMQSANGDREQMHKLMEANRPKIEAELTAVLTPDQQAKLKTLTFEMPKRPSPEEMQAHAEARLQQMKTKLNLTDAQVAQLRVLGQSMRPASGSEPWAHRDASADHQKPTDADRTARKAQFAAKRAEFEAKLAAILTPQQLTTWKAERTSHSGHGMMSAHRDSESSK